MFFIVSTLILTNIFFIPYYFTYQFEHVIINYLIPYLNKIYQNKNKKRIIEVKIFTETNTEPISLNIIHSAETNQYLSYNDINFNENACYNNTEEFNRLIINDNDSTESENSDSTESENSNSTESENSNSTESENNDSTESENSNSVDSDSIIVEMVE